MEENKEKNPNQDTSQGKQSTAETDVTYNQDAEALRHSATTSMADADSDSSIGAGGDRVDDVVENVTDDTETDS